MSFDRMDMAFDRAIGQTRRSTIVGQVMGLLAFSLLFTAGGYLVGRALGPLGMILGVVGSLAAVLALSFARTKMSSGVALGVFYLFSVFEGMASVRLQLPPRPWSSTSVVSAPSVDAAGAGA